MGRKSSLTADQWLEVERRHLVGGESLNSLAIEFGVNESSLRRKLKPKSPNGEKSENKLLSLAKQKLASDIESKRVADEIADLPYGQQKIVRDLEQSMRTTISNTLTGAEISSQLFLESTIAASKAFSRIHVDNPSAHEEDFKVTLAYQRIAANAKEVPLDLLRMAKEGYNPAATSAKPEDDRAKLLQEIAAQLPDLWRSVCKHSVNYPAGIN